MTRDEAMEIVYALRDYVDARIGAYVGNGTYDRANKLSEKLVQALVEASSDREGQDGD